MLTSSAVACPAVRRDIPQRAIRNVGLITLQQSGGKFYLIFLSFLRDESQLPSGFSPSSPLVPPFRREGLFIGGVVRSEAVLLRPHEYQGTTLGDILNESVMIGTTDGVFRLASRLLRSHGNMVVRPYGEEIF